MSNITNTGCTLLGSTFNNSIQILLGIFAFLSLLLKWKMEDIYIRRVFKVFILDSVKQGLSSLLAHSANMLIALILSFTIKNTDQCAWYFVSYTFDTILGVTFGYYFLKCVTFLANKYNFSRLKESGNYKIEDGRTEVIKNWLAQTSCWIIIIALSRTIVGLILWIFSSLLSGLANGIAKIFIGNPHVLLVFVMIVCPGIMNIIQVWIQDQFLKKKIVKQNTLDKRLLQLESNTLSTIYE